MKPPICEVCNDRFDDTTNSLIRFLTDAETEAFDKRSEDDGFVGHRPNTGWFCPLHIDAARTRAKTMTLGEAVRDIREPPAS